MEKIKVYLREDEVNKIRYYKNFVIMDHDDVDLDDLTPVGIDIEQGAPNVYDYMYFTKTDEDGDTEYIALSVKRDHDITFRGYSSNFDLFIDGECISASTDGLEFDDQYDLDEWINDFILGLQDKLTSDWALSEYDESTIAGKLGVFLDKYKN